MGMLDSLYIKNIRSSAVLTGSYVAGEVIGPLSTGVYKVDCSNFTQLKVIAKFTVGSLTDCDIKVEFSEDGTTYTTETISSASVSGAETTLALNHYTLPAATGNYEANLPINTRYIKISALGNGTVTNSLLAIDVKMSVN